MRLIDKIALNRLLSILTSLILGVLKLMTPTPKDEVKPKRKKILPWRKKDE